MTKTLDTLKTARTIARERLDGATAAVRAADAAEKAALEKTRALDRDLEAGEDRATIEAATAALASAHVDLRLATEAHARARTESTNAQQAFTAATAALEGAVDAQVAAEMPGHCAAFEEKVQELFALSQSISIPGEIHRPLNFISPLSPRALRVLDALVAQFGSLDTPLNALRWDGVHPGVAQTARRRKLLGESEPSALPWDEALNTPMSELPKLGQAPA